MPQSARNDLRIGPVAHNLARFVLFTPQASALYQYVVPTVPYAEVNAAVKAATGTARS